MGRLYFRIYLAVLASLALFAILAGITWRVFYGFEPPGPGAEFYQEVAEKLVPAADAAPDAQRQALERWRDLSGYDLALFASDGRLIAEASDERLPFPTGYGFKPKGPRQWRGPFGIHAVQTQDGRWLVAARPSADRGLPRRFAWLLALLGSACAVGVAAYPVVRRLTRNLEQLQSSVEAFGTGKLSTRVTIKGNDEVARLAAKFNGAADRIEALIQSNKSLLANASHELRSPLARLRIGIESLPGAPDRRTAELNQNIKELDQLIGEILLASQLDAQMNDQFAAESVDLVALAAEECARVGADLTVPDQPLPPVAGDPRLLRRLVRILLENARRYAGNAPTEVLFRRRPGLIEFDVLDRGPGVPQSKRERIFEPFYRLPGASERDGGAGLGLALVKQISARHGGTVICLPREDGGTCMRVSLPTDGHSA